ncbi:MAG: GspH/FimT family pseudopilin [Methylococcales bacterium]|nr:prepilin-type N-terminal cleavage/methylation domain-containing protein [Methylococcaceae bacterium]
MRSQSKNNAGFTLIELMVTVAIAAVIMGVAIPSFTDLIARNRMTANANELITALNLARSEAVKRGMSVTVRKVDNKSSTKKSNGANWEDGWDVFTDVDDDGEFDAGNDQLIRTYSALKKGYTLRGNQNFVNSIRYEADGTSSNIGSFVTCEGGNIVGAKLIIVNMIGRVRLGADADTNLIPEKEATATKPAADITSCTDITGF